MNISPIGQNQNTAPNFKSTLVATLPKKAREELKIFDLKGILSILSISIGHDKLLAEKGRRIYLWNSDVKFDVLQREAADLESRLSFTGIKFRALKGTAKAIRERAAQIAKGKSYKTS